MSDSGSFISESIYIICRDEDLKVMPLPKPGDTVKITLMNRETIEGIVEWIDGNGLWIKGTQRSRWVPLEALSMPHVAHELEGKQEQAAE